MIPEKITLTYCAACQTAILSGGICAYKCQYDTSVAKDRPIVIVTYWRREERT